MTGPLSSEPSVCPCGGRPGDDGLCASCGWPINSRKGRREWLPITLVPIGVLVVAAVIFAVALARTPQGAAAAAVRPASAPAAADDLGDLLIEAPPMDMVEIDPYPEHNDGVSIAEAADLDGATAQTPHERLTTAGFVAGEIRWFAEPERRVAYVSVYELRDDKAAAEMVADNAVDVALDSTVEQFTIDIPTAIAYRYSSEADNLYGYQVRFSKGQRLYSVVVVDLDVTQPAPEVEQMVRDIAGEQYDRG